MVTTQQHLRPPTMREHITACGGFTGYLRESRAISRLEDMIRYPITHPGQEGQAVFREGIALFAGLTPLGREKVMLEFANDLRTTRSWPFESSESTRKLTTLANFFAEAALLLPKDEQGDVRNGPHIPAIKSLKDLFEADSFYDHTNPDHTAAKTACLKALWNLGFGFIDFWEHSVLLAHDSTSTQVTVDMWLNEPIKDGFSFEEHPWSLLRKNISSIGQALLQSNSPKKYEFFQAMLFDEDQAVVGKTLQLLAYSTDLPEHFYGLAQSIARAYPDLAPQGNLLHTIIECRKKLSEPGDGQYSAALQLLALYQGGLSYLGPMLQEAGAEMLSNYSEPESSVPSDPTSRVRILASVGIKMPGSRLPVRISPAGELDANADLKQLESLPLQHLLRVANGNKLVQHAIKNKLKWRESYRNATEDQLNPLSFQELVELTNLVWAGRNSITPNEEQELENIGTVVLIKLKQMEEQRKALSVLTKLGMAGIQITGFRLNIQTHGHTQLTHDTNPLYAYVGAPAEALQNLSLAQLKELNEIVRSIQPSEDKLIELDKIALVATRKLEQSGVFDHARARRGPEDSPPQWLIDGARGSPLRFSKYIFVDGEKLILDSHSLNQRFLRVPWMEDSQSWLTDYLFQMHSHRLHKVMGLLRQLDEPVQLLAELDHAELVTLREFVSGGLPQSGLSGPEQASIDKLLSAAMLKLYQRLP